MPKLYAKPASVLGAVLAIQLTAPAALAAAYIKIGGVEGESQMTAEHDKWIVIESVRLADENNAAGGVRVASGDVNGDGHSNAGQSPNAATRLAAPADPGTTMALLLPAIQKVRIASTNAPAWEGCKAGQKVRRMAIRDDETGRTGRVLDATVNECGPDNVSFRFSRIRWR